MHGCYLGGVFASIENGLSAGLIALVVSLQPVLTSTLANRWLGERVLPRQWLGLLLGVGGVYLIVHEKIATGETTPLAWVFAVVALIGITVGTLYQKRFGGGIDWRAGFTVQYATAGIMFVAARVRFRDPRRALDAAIRLRAGLAGSGAVVRRDLAALFSHPPLRRDAGGQPVLPDAAGDGADGLAVLRRTAWRRSRSLGMAICVVGVFLVNWRIGGAAR